MALPAQAVAAAPKATRYPSFAELLRRSKFATYDPAIRQTYQAPPANAHRGDWGVKRPISLRRKNAFISLTSFEHHAHFAEWNHAENQVRFIRRIEEMGGKAMIQFGSPWYKSLGTAKTAPPFDSEFCPGEVCDLPLRLSVLSETVKTKDVQLGTVQEEQEEGFEEEQEVLSEEAQEARPEEVQAQEARSEEVQSQETQSEAEQSKTVNLDTLGKRGPGAYGTQRTESPQEIAPAQVYVTQNILAMSKREFLRYLRSLRAQRPQFKEFIHAQKEIEEKDLFRLAVHEDNFYYRKFLDSQTKKQFADYKGQKMEPRPHPNGALLYTAPTALECLLWSKSKPGFYLHESPRSDPELRRHLVSFGGLVIRVHDNAIMGKNTLLKRSSDRGVEQENIESTILQLRLQPDNLIKVLSLPRTVGSKPQGLKAARLDLVLIKGDAYLMRASNPHLPGSREYAAMSSKDKPHLSTFPGNTPMLTEFTGVRNPDSAKLLKTLAFTVKPGNVSDREL